MGAMMPEHNRWAPNCERFPTKVGPDTQYLIDWHRGETCPVCADHPIRCDYCGDALPSVKSRADVPTTPDLQRLGFAVDKVVCPECVANHTNGSQA
jgi:hypothetical protein